LTNETLKIFFQLKIIFLRDIHGKMVLLMANSFALYLMELNQHILLLELVLLDVFWFLFEKKFLFHLKIILGK
jgi:hypothetical protein